MARSVADLALFLSAIAGPDTRSPLSIGEDGARFRAPLARSFKGTRIAWWKGLGGIPFENDIRRVVESTQKVFTDLGCTIEQAEPDFTGVDEAFPTLRFAQNYAQYAPLVRQNPEWVKDTIKFEVARAEQFSGGDIGRAMARQARMFDQSREFFERYAGRTVRRHGAVPDANCRHADGHVRGLDAFVLVHHLHVQPGRLGSGRLHA
jgi:amidase